MLDLEDSVGPTVHLTMLWYDPTALRFVELLYDIKVLIVIRTSVYDRFRVGYRVLSIQGSLGSGTEPT